MSIFNRKTGKTIKIQSSGIEGDTNNIRIDSLLTGSLNTSEVPGTLNDYMNYERQVEATYSKYNSNSEYGNQQVRAIVDLRTAFIAGEGISISCKNGRTLNWINDFLERNHLNGSELVNAVKGSEMMGHSVFGIKTEMNSYGELETRVYRVLKKRGVKIRVVYDNDIFSSKPIEVQINRNGELNWTILRVGNMIVVRTGGDDSNYLGPVTKVGAVLTDIDNYDRALKDIRRNNYVFARITPVFEVETSSEAKSLKSVLQSMHWKIGKAFIGKAKFRYETPGTSAHENLISELSSTIKTISAVTGVPVHWLGFVDLMSNRSTAESLYENIKNATITERVIWQEALYDIILKAQEDYINAGGDLKFNKDFEVKLPLIDFNSFTDRIKALSLAYSDEAISIDDYRNAIPGINPLKTEKAVEKERKDKEQSLVKMGVPPLNNIEEEKTNE